MIRVATILLVLAAVINAELIYSVSNLEGGNVLCTLTNNGEEAERFLGYGTPFEKEIFAPILLVKDRLGREAKYVGKIGRRVYPAPESSYITVPAGESISAAINIHELFHVHEEGHYTVLPRAPINLRATIGATLTKFLSKSPERQRNIKSALASSFKDCTGDEESIISSHRETAEQYVDISDNCLEDRSCEVYATKWFGATATVNADNYNYVHDLFHKMKSVVDEVDVDCQPSDCGGADTYAYVFPDDGDQIIHICGAYWSTTDDSERTQTIIHEYSHFNAIGNPGTDDTAYGQTDCLALASTDSDLASHNADNIGYFAIDIGENFVPVSVSNGTPVTVSNTSNNNNSSDSTILAPLAALLILSVVLLF